MRRAIVLALLVASGVWSLAVAACRRNEDEGPKIAAIEQVKDNLYLIAGGGGNTAALVTSEGVVLVDTKLPGSGPAILEQVRTVTDLPVTTIINTHAHLDHHGSNQVFGSVVETVAHENARTRMSRQPPFQDGNARFVPNRTFQDKLTLTRGSDQIDLYYFGRGHTDGDTWVVFPSLRVVHAGDMFAAKSAPVIDTPRGGSAVAFPETLSKAVAGLGDVDRIITGHSTVMTRADLAEYAEFNADFLAWTKQQLEAGVSSADAAAAYKVPAKYKGYVAGPRTVAGNVQNIYNQLRR